MIIMMMMILLFHLAASCGRLRLKLFSGKTRTRGCHGVGRREGDSGEIWLLVSVAVHVRDTPRNNLPICCTSVLYCLGGVVQLGLSGGTFSGQARSRRVASKNGFASCWMDSWLFVVWLPSSSSRHNFLLGQWWQGRRAKIEAII